MEQTTIFKPVEVAKVDDIKITMYKGAEVISDVDYEEIHLNKFSTLRCKVDEVKSDTEGVRAYRVRLQQNGIAVMYSHDIVKDTFDTELYEYITVFYRTGNKVTQWTFYDYEYKKIGEHFCLPSWDVLDYAIHDDDVGRNWKKALFELLKAGLEMYKNRNHIDHVKQ